MHEIRSELTPISVVIASAKALRETSLAFIDAQNVRFLVFDRPADFMDVIGFLSSCSACILNVFIAIVESKTGVDSLVETPTSSALFQSLLIEWLVTRGMQYQVLIYAPFT